MKKKRKIIIAIVIIAGIGLLIYLWLNGAFIEKDENGCPKIDCGEYYQRMCMMGLDYSDCKCRCSRKNVF